MCVCVCFQAYMDTLQTQWSWLLQITKCIETHLKENAAYSQVRSFTVGNPPSVGVHDERAPTQKEKNGEVQFKIEN